MRNKLLHAGMLLLSASLICAAQDSRKNGDAPLLQDAAKAITAGKLIDAERELKIQLRSTPDEPRALDLLGIVRVLKHHEIEAGELFRRAIEKNSDFPPAHAHLGLLYVQMGRTDEAIPELREALRLDPARADAADALLQILQGQAQAATVAGNSDKALAFLADARKFAPNDPDIQFEFGTIALNLSLWQDAADAFQKTLQLRENDPLALYNLGRAFIGQSKFEDARTQFARYIEVRPEDAAGHCALGMTLAALERSSEAEAQFNRSIALAPEQTESYFRLGLLELDSKDLESAGRNLKQVLEREPKHAAALAALGRVEFEQKKYPEAADLLQRAISMDDTSREAHYYLGLTFARMGRKQESDRQLQTATELEHAEADRRKTVLRIADPAAGAQAAPPQQ